MDNPLWRSKTPQATPDEVQIFEPEELLIGLNMSEHSVTQGMCYLQLGPGTSLT